MNSFTFFSEIHAAPLNDNLWHHLCVKWRNNAGRWHLFVNATELGTNKGLSVNHEISKTGRVVLGQTQGVHGEESNVTEAFSGDICLFELWDWLSSRKRIQELLDLGCHHKINDGVVDWRMFRYPGVHGAVTRNSPSTC